MKRVASLLLVLMMIFNLVGCGSAETPEEETGEVEMLEWDYGVQKYIPNPNIPHDCVVKSLETDTMYAAKYKNISQETYDDYVRRCKEEMNFTIDVTEKENKFSGENDKGHDISVSYKPNSKIMKIIFSTNEE